VSDSDNKTFQAYAQTILELRISHEAGHAVLAEHFGCELCNLSLDAVVVSAEGAVGGSAEIDFGRLCPKHPDFTIRLQDIATVLMGGVAAEEVTHPHLAQLTHAKQDVYDFKHFLSPFRTDADMDVLLNEGHVRAKALLSSSEIAEQHHRLYEFLVSTPQLSQPNGKYLRRVMKGLST
jgi:hypothetical protein